MTRRQSKTAESRAPAGARPAHQFVVISYDIPDDRRRSRVCDLLKDYGERVQYSVFECQLRAKDLRRLRERLKPLLEPKEDDIRFYLLCATCTPKAVVWSARQRKPLPTAIVV